MKINYFTMAVALLQFVAASWAFYIGDYKLGLINGSVGIANATLSTMAK